MSLHVRLFIAIALALLAPPLLPAADWPMWRFDAARSGTSDERLPAQLHLQWVREYPPLKPAFWQVRQERLQFDLGYEPVVAGGMMFVASSCNDSVTALDARTGAERWRFYADGPVRLAPTAWEGRLYFASDDGCLYCLEAISGRLLWKARGAPSNRKVLGNGRLISVWPARGGPVVHDGRAYFAAGVWPFEGIFVHALDARTGRTVWINDSAGCLYSEHPHGAMSFGGPSPQGYLLVNRARLVVPSSRAFPAFFDLATGKLLSFDFGHGGHGSRPGGWFVASDGDGGLMVDSQVNTEMHDAGQQVIGQASARRQEGEELAKSVTIGAESYSVKAGAATTIRVGGREYRFGDGVAGVEGIVHTMLAANGQLFVVTRAGQIHCFGAKPVTPKRYPAAKQPLGKPSDDSAARARSLLQLSGQSEGYAVVLGLGTGRLAEELAAQSPLHVIVVDADAKKVAAFRRRLDAAGLYGGRIVAHAANPLESGLPPYLAGLIVCEEADAFGERLAQKAFETLRPYGGVLCLKTAKLPALAGAQVRREGEWTLAVRAGALPGAADYNGEPNYDERVKAPLGLLWFGDTFHHHKLFFHGFTPESGRGLPAYLRIAGGVMSYLVRKQPVGMKPASMSYPDFFREAADNTSVEARTDVYTGRILSRDATGGETSAQRPSPAPLARRNPITGVEEAREFMKTYGCDQFGADYGNLITLRSGTAAFYDKRLESGTINISGVRSGCRNSIVPACGVLNVPAWTGNCTCNYPVFTSLAMVSMPPTFEQWSAWGGVAMDALVQRVGINFGAPGDRKTDDGTLWLDWPGVGGPSPEVRVQVTPPDAQPYYRHSLWMRGGAGWPWVFASGLKGARAVRIETVARSTNAPSAGFGVRWSGFVRPERSETNTFHVRSDGTVRLWVGGFPVIDTGRFTTRDPAKELAGKRFLEAGKQHDLRVEYAHAATAKTNWPAFIELSWSSPSRPKVAMPAASLFAPDGRPGGLAGVYYATSRVTGPGWVRVDPQVNFDWGRELPPPLKRRAMPDPAAGRAYTVRLVFAEPEEIRAGERVFTVKLQGKEVLKGFDILKTAGGPNRGVVREFHGVKAREALEIEFEPSTPKPALICGVEMIAEDAGRKEK